MARYSDILRDQFGSPIVKAKVVVARSDGGAVALYDDGGNPFDNPLTTDKYGAYYFNTDPGYYDLSFFLRSRKIEENNNVPVGVSPDSYAPGSGQTAAWQAWLNALAATGAVGIVPSGVRTYGPFTIPTGLNLAFEPGAVLRRDPASGSNTWITATNVHGFSISGTLELDGAGASTATANTLLTIDGCYDWHIEGFKARNAKAVSGSYGNLLTLINGADQTQGTRSTIGSMDISGGNYGTYGVQIIKTLALSIGTVSGTGCPNAALAIHNFDLPVPANPTQSRISIGDCVFWNNGIGLEALGFRSGVGPNGEIIAIQVTTEDLLLGNVLAYDNTYHGVALQGMCVNAGRMTLRGNGTSGSSYGGLLANVMYSTFAGGTSHGDGYFGVDAGLSFDSNFGNWVILSPGSGGTGCIGFNLGATRNCVVSGLQIDLMPTNGIGVRLSGFDGAGAGQFAGWVGTNTWVLNGKINLTNAAQVGIQVLNGYSASKIDCDITGTVGTPTDCSSQGPGNILNVRRLNSDGSDTVTIAGAEPLIVPDYAKRAVVTGGAVNISTVYFQSDYTARKRPTYVLATSPGTNYRVTDTITITGDGTGTVTGTLCVTGDGKVVGAILNASAASNTWTTATATITTSTGSGAVLLVFLGGTAVSNGKQLQLAFTGNSSTAPTLKKTGTFTQGTVALSADFVASAFNLSNIVIGASSGLWSGVSAATNT